MQLPKITRNVSLIDDQVTAGFPNPANDYPQNKLDLNDFIVKHPNSTFFIKVRGDSMKNAGINDDDILVIDKSLEANDGSIVVAILNGEFTVKRFRKRQNYILLEPEYETSHPTRCVGPLRVDPMDDFEVWGVVTHVIHSTK